MRAASVRTGKGEIGLHSTCAHVLHIGYHKTASTWLQLHVFPNLRGLRCGEPLLRQLGANLATASDELLFASAFHASLRQLERLPGGPLLLSDEGISGSLWDGYGSGPKNAERLHRVLPRAKILIVVRRQDEMLRSIHGQYVNEGGTRPLRDFIAGRDLEGSRFSLRHLEYDHLVVRYVELFGRERVWVAPYECLRAHPDRFLDDLCEFLGSRLTAPVPRTRENQTLSKPALWLLRTWNRLFRASRFNPNPRLGPLRGGRRVRNLLQRRLDPMIRGASRRQRSSPNSRLSLPRITGASSGSATTRSPSGAIRCPRLLMSRPQPGSQDERVECQSTGPSRSDRRGPEGVGERCARSAPLRRRTMERTAGGRND